MTADTAPAVAPAEAPPDTSPVIDYPQQLRLDDKAYAVIGAGQGMGRQSAHALAQAGAKVLCMDIEADRAQQVASETGGQPFTGDATQRADLQALADTAQTKLGGIDGFVDIVGMARWGGVLDITDEDWDWQFDMVLRHAYLATQILGRPMAEQGRGGTMVFVASVSALTAAPNHAAYGAAKAALMAWMKSVAVELAPHKIRANAVAPGTILTPRMEALFDQERTAQNNQLVPLGAMGRPSDIASAALFLSSPLSGFITGRTLVVDGGVDVKFPYSPM